MQLVERNFKIILLFLNKYRKLIKFKIFLSVHKIDLQITDIRCYMLFKIIQRNRTKMKKHFCSHRERVMMYSTPKHAQKIFDCENHTGVNVAIMVGTIDIFFDFSFDYFLKL